MTDGVAKSARCSQCNINYPPHRETCEVCGGELSKFSNIEVDADWRENANRARMELEADTIIKWEVGVTGLGMFKGLVMSLQGADDFILECEAATPMPPIGWDGDEQGFRIPIEPDKPDA